MHVCTKDSFVLKAESGSLWWYLNSYFWRYQGKSSPWVFHVYKNQTKIHKNFIENYVIILVHFLWDLMLELLIFFVLLKVFLVSGNYLDFLFNLFMIFLASGFNFIWTFLDLYFFFFLDRIKVIIMYFYDFSFGIIIRSASNWIIIILWFWGGLLFLVLSVFLFINFFILDLFFLLL